MEIQYQKQIEDAKKNAGRMVQEAEKSKAQIVVPKGRSNNTDDDDDDDDAFFHVTTHAEAALISKIELGQYVDLVKLFPSTLR